MVEISFKYKNKKISLDAKECKGLRKFSGLMFKSKNTPPLLFKFKKPTSIKIHSLFCTKFIAVWLDKNNKVVDLKIVKPWKPLISSRKPFVKLIEIPASKKNKEIIKMFTPFAN